MSVIWALTMQKQIDYYLSVGYAKIYCRLSGTKDINGYDAAASKMFRTSE